MSITSYAQNFEDVMLWRALGHIENGDFIDIGAQDPIVDSVSLAFCERGWRGVHVEPTPYYAELLRQQRPGDVVIQAAVGSDSAVLQFFEIPHSGISTADAGIAALHRERGFDVHEIVVPCVTLASVFEASKGKEIHWLKIDVEGLERQVLSSWGTSTARPWIVVVESTLPMTQTETHESWEAILCSYGYIPVYFDGLNRFYLSEAHPEIQDSFRAPPNVFDRFSLSGTSSASFHQLMEQRRKENVAEVLVQVERQKQSTDSEIAHLNTSLASLQVTLAEQDQRWAKRELEIDAQMLTLERQAVEERNRLAQSYIEQEREVHRQHVDRENALSQRLQAGHEELRHLREDRTRREEVLSERAGQIQERLENLLRELAQREKEFAAQLLTIQRQAVEETADITRSYHEQDRALRRRHAEREQILNSRLEAEQRALQRLEQARAQQEREYVEKCDQSRHVIEGLLRGQIERERQVVAQLVEIHERTTQEREALVRNHSEQELALRHQQAEREQALITQHQAVQTDARQQRELQAKRHDAELSAVVDRHDRLINAYAVLEEQLKTEILAEQKNNLLLRETLERVQASLDATQASIIWRMTAPLRKLALFGAATKSLDLPHATDDRPWQAAQQSPALRFRGVVSEDFASVVLDQVVSSTAQKEMGEDLSPNENNPSIPESIATEVRNASIGSIMLPSTQVANTVNPAAAQTLGELLAHHDQQFIVCAYRTLLGRFPDPVGMTYYLKRLRAGISKLQLLKQLRTSTEGRARAVQLNGLDTAIRRYQRGNIPLIGWIFRALNDAEGSGAVECELRAIENRLHLVSDESNHRFTQLDATLAGLRDLILQQTQLIVTSMANADSTVLVALNSSPARVPEPVGLARLLPSAKEIYFQLKEAANRAGEQV